jgi:glycosyltransferase involved in cell wall biosynthesis
VTRLLVHSHVPVGSAMSSPGIRAYHLARELATDFDVTLMAPNKVDAQLDRVDVRVGSVADARALDAFDVVVAQKLPPATMRHLARSHTRVIYDLYTPSALESLAVLEKEPSEGRRLLTRSEAVSQQLALATGNAFICPGDRQRDLWLGMLGALGRIDLDVYRRDRTLRSLIDVVPFGLPAERPTARERVAKGVIEGIREHHRVLLWMGGVLDWTDPFTPIRAVARISESRNDVKLLFVGLAPPSGPLPATAARALALARSLGVLDRSVFFQPGWVGYEQRESFLLEADLGVAAYLDNVENRFAFRARLLDYFWAGLPTVTTGGDELGALVRERELGRALGFHDVDGWIAAIVELLDDERARRRIGANLEHMRKALAWPNVVEPLRRLAAVPGAPVRRRTATTSIEDLWLRSRLSYELRGPVGFLGRQARKLAPRG